MLAITLLSVCVTRMVNKVKHPSELLYLQLRPIFEQAQLVRHDRDVSVLWHGGGAIYLDRHVDDAFRMFCYGALNSELVGVGT